MKLRSVEMVGFKSFRDRECLEISDGITCIVGPNGCGKSNVVDAIKWAMGDMSPKSLRGESLSDVIFAGTEESRPAGMAEVTLTFDNTDEDDDRQITLDEIGDQSPGSDDVDESAESADIDGDDGDDGEPTSGELDLGESIPREFQDLAEIAITRRLHQSGESEYLINKVPCRLRDIRNLLAGTGLGKQGYSIIEQGQIGFIVNARPSERRMIIEEASGITRYKDQRKRSARKLERTEQNLQRTRDVLDEIEKQMTSLEAQAEKAKEHKELSEELELLEVALLVDRRSKAVTKKKKLTEKLDAANENADDAKEKLDEIEKNLKKTKKDAEQADRRHDDLTENYYKVETRLNLAKSNRKHAMETRDQAVERRQELIEQRDRQKERRSHLSEELERVEGELEAVEEQPDDVEEAIEELETKRDSLGDERSEIVARRDEVRESLEEKKSRIQRIDDRLEWLDEQLQEFDDRKAELDGEIEDVKEERDDLQRSISRLSVDHDRAREQTEVLEQDVESAKSKLDEAKSAAEEAEGREQELARRKMELETRIESLETMRQRGEGYEEGVRRVIEWAQEQERDDVLGPAGDFLQVPEGQEAAYAAFIGDRIGDLVVGDRQAALDALAVLDDEEAGRVGCFPLPDGVDDPRQLVERWVEGLEVVDDLRDVPELMGDEAGSVEASSRSGWATDDGDVIFSDGRVVGGGTGEQAETLLRQVRELERLGEELTDVVEEHDEAGEVLDLLREEVVVAEEQLEKKREEFQESKHRARGIKQELDGEHREKERADKRLQRLENQRKELATRDDKLQDEQQELEQERSSKARTIPGQQEKLGEIQEEVRDCDDRIEKVEEELTERKIQVAQVDERRRHLEENVERLREGIDDSKEQIEHHAKEIEEQKTRRNEARMKADALASEIEELEDDHEQLDKEVEEAGEVLEELNERVESLELAVLGRRQDLEEAKEKVQQLEMKQQETKIEIDHATEQLEERFELDLEAARRRRMQVDTPPDECKERAQFLKKRLDSIGEVNPLAIEEFEESKERHAFHAEQQSDLEESVADLRSAIDRMDRESRRRFGETFEAVDEKFREVFPRLFQGGQARLILTDPDDLLETGVDIEVQPPGKKLQNVSLLSGGEKALTAVSLIFAIFILKPSPFAILDEVDAPLDDANVGRFADMVTELSAMSQMILITHNRRTMEAPDRLYGVTMEEAGISKLVSVKLSEVDEDRMAS